ncbi:MAG: hypothetical protein ACLU4J_12630 [Butyricimonas paravirosa]
MIRRKFVTGLRERLSFLRGWYYYMLVNLYANLFKGDGSKGFGVPLNVTEFIEDKYFSGIRGEGTNKLFRI